MLIKLAMADDHPMVTNGIEKVLGSVDYISIMGIFRTAEDLLSKIKPLAPDVLLLDLELGDNSDGYQTACTVVKALPDLKILVFSNNDSIYHVKKMLQAGCLGYILKDSDDETFLNAINSVYNGHRFFSPSIEAAILQDVFSNKPLSGKRTMLTKREKEVLALVVQEYTNQEIADKLFLSLSTVEFHRTSMFQKLGVKNTAGLVRVAVQQGLV